MITAPAYLALIARLSSDKPRDGFDDWRQVLPLLTPADVACIVTHGDGPEIVGDALDNDLLQESILLHAEGRMPHIDYAALVTSSLRQHCARYIVSDLMAHCENQAATDRRDLAIDEGRYLSPEAGKARDAGVSLTGEL